MTEHQESAALRDVAIQAAYLVRDPLRAVFRSAIEVGFKVDRHDIVTEHDRASEDTIRRFILSKVPDSAVLGEEDGARGEGRVQWYVDPIDGTSNFARGLAFWCVSIGAVIDDRIVAGAVYDPIADHMFSADPTGAWLNGKPIHSRAVPDEQNATLITGYPVARDFRLDGRDVALARLGQLIETFCTVRRVGSAALSICHVAAGWMDAASGFGVNAWDVAAAKLILEKAGGNYLPLGLGKVDDDAPAHMCPGYVACGEGGNYPTLLSISKEISEKRSAENRIRLKAANE